GTSDTHGLYLGSLDSPEIKRLIATDGAPVFAAPNHVLLIEQSALVIRQLDLSSGTLSQKSDVIAPDVGLDANTFRTAVSASANGVFCYRNGAHSRRQLVWFDRAGKATGTLGPVDDSIFAIELSPDGKRAAVS